MLHTSARLMIAGVLAIAWLRAAWPVQAAEAPRAGSVQRPADEDDEDSLPDYSSRRTYGGTPAAYSRMEQPGADAGGAFDPPMQESLPTPPGDGGAQSVMEGGPRYGDGSPRLFQGRILRGDFEGPMFPRAHALWEEWDTPPLLVNSTSWFSPDRFYTIADVTVMNHERPRRNFRLAIDAATDRIFDNRSLSLGITGGERVTVGYWICRTPNDWEHSVEATFQGPENWHRHFDLVGRVPGSIFSFENTGLGGFNGADAAFFYYKSLYDSGEVNLRFTKRGHRDQVVYDDGVWKQEAEDGAIFSFILGLKNTVLIERFDYMSRRAGTATTTFGGDDNIKSVNDLLGINFGTDVMFHHDSWYAGFMIKGTPSLNFASARDDLVFNDAVLGSGTRHTKAARTETAFATDMRFYAGWKIRPRMDLHVSYDFNWLTSIALAPEQINFSSDERRVYAGNDLFMNGASLGLDIHW